jgi:hypothetical protein
MCEEKETFNMNVPLSFEMTCSSEGVHLIYNETTFLVPQSCFDPRVP